MKLLAINFKTKRAMVPIYFKIMLVKLVSDFEKIF